MRDQQAIEACGLLERLRVHPEVGSVYLEIETPRSDSWMSTSENIRGKWACFVEHHYDNGDQATDYWHGDTIHEAVSKAWDYFKDRSS